MKRLGRPPGPEEGPDSAFGDALKEHLRRVKNFTQVELSRETLIAERTLSNMVKGKRESGTTLRRDLRTIIEVLYQKKALLTLEEANALITKIPATSPLDERVPEDAEIIALFDPPVPEAEQAADQQSNDAAIPPDIHVSSESLDDELEDSAEEGITEEDIAEPTITPLPILPSPVSEPTGRSGREMKKRRWWYAGSALVALMVILGIVLLGRSSRGRRIPVLIIRMGSSSIRTFIFKVNVTPSPLATTNLHSLG